MNATDDDIKFDELLQDKRHKELMGSLRELLTHLGKEKPDNGVAQAILKHSETFATAIKNLPQPEKQDAPVVNIQSNHGEVVKSLQEMGKNILSALSDLKDSMNKEPVKKEWRFDIVRNHGGYINSITAKEL